MIIPCNSRYLSPKSLIDGLISKDLKLLYIMNDFIIYLRDYDIELIMKMFKSVNGQ